MEHKSSLFNHNSSAAVLTLITATHVMSLIMIVDMKSFQIVAAIILCASVLVNCNPILDRPRETSSSSWNKLVNCFRRKLGPKAIFNHDVRCTAKEMIAVFDQMSAASCKSCEQ